MKNKFNYLLYICNIFLVGLIFSSISINNVKKIEVYVSDIEIYNSKFISYLQKEPLKIAIEENMPNPNFFKEDNDLELVNLEKEKIKEEVKEKEIIVSNNNAVETIIGNLVGYGPDCYGCTSMMTASGKYVGEGNIYYNDSTYGIVRIVAGDPSYPFGTIVKVSNVDFYDHEPFYAIVLDRGGDIGKNKKFLFDLLFASESEAYKLGKDDDVKYEILRLGY